MATVVISHDPSGITKKEMFQVDGCVIEWLVDRYKDGFKVPTKVFLNTPSNEIDLREYPNGLVTDDVVIIAHQPAGGAEALINPFVWIPATIDYIKSLAPIEPSYDAPENFDTGTAGSPNNKINGQTNIVRLGEKIPQIYGRFKSYPDTIMPSYGEWVGSQWVLTEYFLISDGGIVSADISNVKRDNTPLFNIPPYSLLPPEINELGKNNGWANTTLFSQTVKDISVNTRPISGSNDLYLIGSNLGGDSTTFQATQSGAGNGDRIRFGIYYASGGIPQINQNSIAISNLGTSVSQQYIDFADSIKDVTQGDLVEINTTISGVPTGFFFVDKIESSKVDDLSFTNILLIDLLSPSIEANVGNTLTLSAEPVRGDGIKVFGPYLSPIDSDGVVVDVSARNGLIDKNGNQLTANIVIEYQLESGGTKYTTNRILTGATRSAKNVSYNIEFPSNGVWNIWVYRSDTESIDVSDSDVIYCDNIKTYNKINASEDQSKSTLIIKTKVESERIRSGKVNCIYGRPIPIFNYTTRTFDAQAVTSRFDLILMHHMVNVGGVPLNQINTDDLEEIVAAMPLDLIQYNGTLAGKNTPLDNDIAAICGAARVSSYKQGSMYRFYGDYAKPVTMVFGITDKEQNADNKTIQMRLLNDFDGIEMEFKNASNDYEPETIYIPELAVRRKKIDGVGMTSYAQALSRANYEYARLRYQRTSFKTAVTNKGIIPDLGDVVRISDDTRADSVSAEVLRIDGNSIFISEKINAPINSNGKMLFGEFSIDVRVRGDYELLWLIGSPANLETRGQNGNQKGTTVIFVSSGDIADYPKWMITNKKYSGQSVDLECVNYDERLYDGDS